MYRLNVTDSFSAAHKLCGYQGACSNLHGHNWKVRLCLSCTELDEIGMAMDFGIIKQVLKRVLDQLDHRYLNDIAEFTTQNPTSEHLARYIYEKMEAELESETCHVYEVEIWESEKSSVVYSK